MTDLLQEQWIAFMRTQKERQFFFPTIISCIVVETKLFFDLNNLTFNLAMQSNFLFDLNFAFYIIFFSLANSRHHLCCPKCFLFCPEAKVYLQTLPHQLQAGGNNTRPSVTNPLESFEATRPSTWERTQRHQILSNCGV